MNMREGVRLMQRVTVYIDGFNLYYGLRDQELETLPYWLDVRRLSENLLRFLVNQHLVAVRYFTARVAP